MDTRKLIDPLHQYLRKINQGGGAGRPERRCQEVKLIDQLRSMNADELAAYLVERCAEVPPEFCKAMCDRPDDPGNCEGCKYVGEDGDRIAWKTWLERETDGKVHQEKP